MKLSKILLISLFAAALMLPLVLAQRELTSVGNIWDTFLKFFSLKPWLEMGEAERVAAFVRLVLFFTVFAIFHNVLKNIGGQSRTFTPRTSGVIAFAIAAISAVFMPAEILITIGEAYGTIIAWALIGLTIFGIIYLLYGWIKPSANMSETMVGVTRIIGLLLVYWVLSAVHGGVVPFTGG